MERLEFSTLRHSRFSTACMLHMLLSPKKDFVTRWPDNNRRAGDTIERYDTHMTDSPEKTQGSTLTGASSGIVPQAISSAASPDAVLRSSPMSEAVIGLQHQRLRQDAGPGQGQEHEQDEQLEQEHETAGDHEEHEAGDEHKDLEMAEAEHEHGESAADTPGELAGTARTQEQPSTAMDLSED